MNFMFLKKKPEASPGLLGWSLIEGISGSNSQLR